jgi:hypothetical protein
MATLKKYRKELLLEVQHNFRLRLFFVGFSGEDGIAVTSKRSEDQLALFASKVAHPVDLRVLLYWT